MKKVLLFIITLFISCNVYALDIELRVTNPKGVEIKGETENLTIPYQATVKLKDETEGLNASVEYNGKTVSIKKTDLKPTEDVFKDINGTKLDKTEAFKIFDKNGLEIYNGPSTTFYSKTNKVIPNETELTYNYTYGDYAYVTYDNVSGWVFLDLASEKVAKKEISKIMIINSKNIELKDKIDGEKIISTIKNYEVLDYAYITKYQYNVTYNNKSLWLSIIGEDAIATVSTIDNINLVVGNIIYEQPNTTKQITDIKENKTVKPLFKYNDFYYIEFDNIKGWVKPENVIGEEDTNIVELTEKEVIAPAPIEEQTVKDNNKKIPTKVELIIIVGLAVILLLSLTSLITVVIMNKKNGNELQKNIDESNNSDTTN